MKLWQDLFSTDYGLMSIIGLGIIILMAFWYIAFFIKKANEPYSGDYAKDSKKIK